MKKIIFNVFFTGILITQTLECHKLEEELNDYLEKHLPIKKQKEEIRKETDLLNKKVEEMNKQLNSWGKEVIPLIEDIIRDTSLTIEAKIRLLQRFLKETDKGPNDIFITIEHHKPYAISYNKINQSFFSFLVSKILENDARNCPLDLIQAFMVLEADPGSESEIRISKNPYSFLDLNPDERHDAHCVVKNVLKKETSEACKKCAQKIDDLFNEYKKSTKK